MHYKIKQYSVLKEIQKNGNNADVFLVQNENNTKLILKQFNSPPQPYVGLSKHNHFGRRREGAESVFEEIKSISQKYPFLLNLYERFKHNGKWCIVIEYIQGVTLAEYISINRTNKKELQSIIASLAQEVAFWHNNDFALGDAHLKNVMVESNSKKVKLIDYGQLHHPSFIHCIKFNCYAPHNKRIERDLRYENKRLGKGFVIEIDSYEERLGIGYNLPSLFEAIYTKHRVI